MIENEEKQAPDIPAMPEPPEGCSHGPWIDESFGSWVCIRYGLSLYVWESKNRWYFVEHVSDTIQRRLDALSEETERKNEALNVLAKACNSAASSAQSPSDEFHWAQYWKVCQSAIDGVEAQ